jgi:hypothetical protein
MSTKQAAMYISALFPSRISQRIGCADAVQNVFLSLALLELRQSKI